MLSISEMMAQIVRHYPLKAHLYEVRIFGGDPTTDAPEELMINCSAINVPGKNLQFTPHKKYSIGTFHNIPIGRSFTELNLTLYETEFEQERRYFSEWQDRIYDRNNRRFNYFQDYVKTLSIIQYDKKGNRTYECQVLESFPSNVSPLDKGYSNEGLAQFNVNMQFHEVKEIFFDPELGTRPFGIF